MTSYDAVWVVSGSSLLVQQAYAENLPCAQHVPQEVHCETCGAHGMQRRLHLICHIAQDLDGIFPSPHFAIHIYQGVICHHIWLTPLVLQHS